MRRRVAKSDLFRWLEHEVAGCEFWLLIRRSDVVTCLNDRSSDDQRVNGADILAKLRGNEDPCQFVCELLATREFHDSSDEDFCRSSRNDFAFQVQLDRSPWEFQLAFCSPFIDVDDTCR